MLSEILSTDRIMIDLEPADKRSMLAAMVHRLEILGQVENREAVTDILVEREKMVSTGVKEGFAFPHAFTPLAKDLTLTIGCAPKGTDFESLDGKPVEFLFLLLGPPSRQDRHLRILARLSRIASKPGMLKELREAGNPNGILDALMNSDRSLAAY